MRPYRIYRRAGYTPVFFMRTYSGTDEEARAFIKSVRAGGVDVRPAGREDIDALARLYDEWASTYLSPVKRSRGYWERKILSDKPFYHTFYYDYSKAFKVLVAEVGGEPAGYSIGAVASKFRRRWLPQDVGHVLEVVGTDSVVVNALLKEVLKELISSGAKSIYIHAPTDRRYLGVSKFFEVFKGGVYMALITDLYRLFKGFEEELSRRVEESGIDFSTSIGIKTPTGSLSIRVSGPEVSVEELRGGEDNTVILGSDEVVKLLHGTAFSKLLIDGLSQASLTRGGLKALKALFPGGLPYISPIDHW